MTPLANKQQWIAGAKMFSGRPDPIWTISYQTAGKLLRLWDRLTPHRGPKLTPPGLGYRGCFLQERHLDRRWEAYEGVVSLGAEIRSDPHRSFESALLNTAPLNSRISASVLNNR
jgi:hypothetical protein